MSREVTLHASKKKGGAPAKMAGKLRHILVKEAKGGVTTESFRHPEAGQDMYNMPEPTPVIHTDAEGLKKHLESEMPDSFPKPKAKAGGPRAAADAGKPDADGDDDDD